MAGREVEEGAHSAALACADAVSAVAAERGEVDGPNSAAAVGVEAALEIPGGVSADDEVQRSSLAVWCAQAPALLALALLPPGLCGQ